MSCLAWVEFFSKISNVYFGAHSLRIERDRKLAYSFEINREKKQEKRTVLFIKIFPSVNASCNTTHKLYDK